MHFRTKSYHSSKCIERFFTENKDIMKIDYLPLFSGTLSLFILINSSLSLISVTMKKPVVN